MFDSVARAPREGRTRRGAALLLALLTSAAVFTLLASLTPPVAEPNEPVAVMFFPGPMELPAAPKPPGGGAPAKKRARPPAGSLPVEAPRPVEEVAASVVAVPSPAPERGGGEPGGPGGGGPGKGPGPGGPGTGPGPGGPGEGEGGGGIKQVENGVAIPSVRVKPTWPRAAVAVGLTEARCHARMTIDEVGVPTAVDFVDCPVVFQAETRQAAMQWRWYPVVDEGRAVAARFDIQFLFRR